MSSDKVAPEGTPNIGDEAREAQVSSPASALLSNVLDPVFRANVLADAPSDWHGHVPFAHWIVAALRPLSIVELGTQNGVSYSAFCEEVIHSQLDETTISFAVISPEVDLQNSLDSSEALEKFEPFHNARYARFSTLVRATFAEARYRFADNSIELLHIAGLRTEEAIERTVETWLPKVSQHRGIILIHHMDVGSAGLGAPRHWNERLGRFPRFHFPHAAGLEVLLIGRDLPGPIAELAYLSNSEAERFRTRFEVLGRAAADAWVRKAAVEDKISALDSLGSQAEMERIRLAKINELAISELAGLREDNDLIRRRFEQEVRARRTLRSQTSDELSRFRSQTSDELSRLRVELLNATARLKQRDQTIHELHSSTSWKLTAPIRIVMRALKPHENRLRLLLNAVANRQESRRALADSLRRRFKLALGRSVSAPDRTAFSEVEYRAWVDKFDTLFQSDENEIRQHIGTGALPAISVLVIVEEGLEETTRSLNTQLSPPNKIVYWHPSLRSMDDVPKDPPIGQGIHISGGVDALLQQFDEPQSVTLIVRGGTSLSTRCLYEVAVAAASSSGCRFIYGDDDRRDRRGGQTLPFFKPDFSPELLRWMNFIGDAAAIRDELGLRRIIEAISHGSSVENALVKYASSLSRADVIHVPSVLFHTASDRMPSVSRAPELRDPEPLPSVSIIIPTRDAAEILRHCIESIVSISDYPREAIEILVLDNQSAEPETLEYFGQIEREHAVRIIPYPHPFNYARICNLGANSSSNSVLIFLNNDTRVHDPLWIRKLVRYVLQADIGSVGAKLLYPDGTVQHGGMLIGIGGGAAHTLIGKLPNDGGYAGLGNATREMSAVTGACLAIRKEVFEEVGGFDTALAVAFNDVKLNIQLNQAGYRVICIRDPLLFHHEAKTRGRDDTPAKVALFQKEARHTLLTGKRFFKNDPYYNPNLSLDEAYKLAIPPRTAWPWRQDAVRRGAPIRVMLLSSTYQIGDRQADIIDLQAQHLFKSGFEVFLGGPRCENEFQHPGCRRVVFQDPQEAAVVAFELRIDCLVVHTPPFYSTLRWIGGSIRSVAYDHGDPGFELFALDDEPRREINSEKQQCIPLADRSIAISESIKAEAGVPSMEVIRLGNSHLARWRGQFDERMRARQKLGLQGNFVVLSVGPFHEAVQNYRGIDQYRVFADEFEIEYPQLASKTVFVLCGEADPQDVAGVGLRRGVVKANVTDQEMEDLYLAADCYANFSRWDGYDFGIARAQAMGLPVVASDIPAHKELSGVSIGDPESLTHVLARLVMDQSPDEASSARAAAIEEWERPLQRFTEIIREAVLS